jgi:hypothetical protein
MSRAEAPPTPGVTFEVDRFEWTGDDELRLVGRWYGLRGHRFLRPTLDVEVAGERRRMLAVLEHKPWAAEDGGEWVAAFSWRGERLAIDDAELTVSPDLAVQLPAPDGSARGPMPKPAAPAAERRPARRPRTAVLEDELAAALAESSRLTEELAKARQTHSEAARELRERVRVAQEDAKRLGSELEDARERIAVAEAEASERVATAEVEARRAVERARDERESAESARESAMATAAEARDERDAALKKAAAAESERDALIEARDRARQERNAWMQRARAASAGARRGTAPIAERVRTPAEPPTEPLAAVPEPDAAVPKPLAPVPEPDAPPVAGEPAALPPPGERRTIQIGQRPGPTRPAPAAHPAPRPRREAWTPRLAAIVALAAFAVILAVLLLFAL